MNNNSEEKISFESWLIRKREQLENERDLKKKIEQYKLMTENSKTQTPEERSKAYKE